jgi:hypothetical protein
MFIDIEIGKPLGSYLKQEVNKEPPQLWKVYNGKRWIGIIESNYAQAEPFWRKTWNCTLKPYNNNHLVYGSENS